MAQWIEHWPTDRRVAGSIPSQDTCLGCGAGPRVGTCKREEIDVFLTHHVSLPLSMNKFEVFSLKKDITCLLISLRKSTLLILAVKGMFLRYHLSMNFSEQPPDRDLALPTVPSYNKGLLWAQGTTFSR